MPVQNKEWLVNYNGYQFTMMHPIAPTEDDAKWAFDNYVLGNSGVNQQPGISPDTSITIPNIDFGYIETDLERAQRNAVEVGSSQPDKDYRDATFMGRFWDSAKTSFIPFGQYEPQVAPADETSEIWADALGGLIGAVPSFILASAVTGGVGGITTKGPKVISQYRKVRKALDMSKRAAKAGRPDQAKRFEGIAENVIKRNSDLFTEAVITKSMPVTTGALGALKPYRNTILKIAERNPKLARSLNLFSNNVIAFNLYGQTRFPIDQIEGRLDSLGADTAAALVFSVAGLPTMLGAKSAGIKYGVEPAMLIGAGMYSDLMQTDMTMEERFIHGLSLGMFHYARQGLSKVNIKEKLETAIRTTIPEIGDANLKKMIESKGVDNIWTAVTNHLSKNKTDMFFYEKKNPQNNVRIVNVRENTKLKKPRHELIYENIADGTTNRMVGKDRADVLRKFTNKYELNSPKTEVSRKVGRALDTVEKDLVKSLKVNKNFLRKALGAGRSYTVKDMGLEAAISVKNPVVDGTGKTSEFLKDNKTPEGLKKGDNAKIPFWNEETQSFDYNRAGIGKYVGRLKDFKEGEVIIPEGLSPEFKASNPSVFEIKTHGGQQTQKIAIGGKMPANVIQKITQIKSSDSPQLQYDTAESILIKENPLVKQTSAGAELNPNSPLFNKLFTTRKPGGKDADVRKNQSIVIDGKEYFPRSNSSLKKVSRLLENGITPESAISYEESVISKSNEKLSASREQSRADWERIRNLNESDPNLWPDMNRMKKGTNIDKKAYESYPELDPLNEKPFKIELEQTRNVQGEIVKDKFTASQEGKDLRFRTKRQAKEWAETNWVSNEGIENQLKLVTDKVKNIEEPSKEWRKQQGRLKKSQRESGVSDIEYKELLKLLFPKSEGTSTKMTYEELITATALFGEIKPTTTFQNQISSTVPPVDFMSKVQRQYRKFLLGVSKVVLPTYTVLGMVKSKAANVLAGKQIDFELMRQSISGSVSEWKSSIRKKYNLSDKQFESLSTILDGKYADYYNPILDGLPKKEIINDYTVLSDSLIIAMIENGVEVRNARKGGSHEKMFRAFDKNGTEIILDLTWDSLRIAKGYEFLDSQNNTKVPYDLKKQPDVEYLKSLRTLNEATGEYNNGWFIVGRNRYIPEWKGDKFVKLRKLSSKEIDTADGRKNVKVYKDKNGKEPGVNHHIKENYLMRMVTDEFRDMIGMDYNFRKNIALKISQTDPQFTRMKGTPQEKFEAALAHIEAVSKYWADSAGVFGTQWSRIADLPPSILIEKGTNKIIDAVNFKDINGNTVSKGSTIIDANGNKKQVGRIIDVYERNFDTIITRYAQKVAHIVPTYKHFGRGGALNKDKTADLFSRLTLETNESFSQWAKEQLTLQVNSVEKNHVMENILNPLTSFTAQIGLSSPMSGIKNLILGQASVATVYGFRGAMNGMFRTFTEPRRWSKITGALGGKDAGVHELMSGRVRYSRYNPGMMRPTEIINRIISVSVADPMLETHINNLRNIKTPMNRGVSKKTSMRVLSEVFKFTDKQISEMKNLGVEKLESKHYTRAQQMSHLITQGGPSLPFVPMWMGKWWAKPMTLFYRVAYRMSENVVNSVMKPAIIDGNPVPLLRYMTIVPIAGEALFSMYYGILGEEQRNRFKTKPEEYWMAFLRAEGLVMLSNAADGTNGVIDSYKPVVARVVTSLLRETSATIQGKKSVPQSLEDLGKENIVFLNHATRVVRRFTEPTRKRVEASKRRQRQFSETYFRNNPIVGDENDFLSTRSPYYKTVRDAFWSEDAEVKAQAYYAALNYVTHDEVKKNPALIKSPYKAKKMAKKILKSLVSNQRPIAKSWQKRTTGKRTRYDLYMSKLKPEFQQEEKDLIKLYNLKVREFNSAINKYRNQFGMESLIPPNESTVRAPSMSPIK